jgi:uncharacterized protein (TIRG00374 family)
MRIKKPPSSRYLLFILGLIFSGITLALALRGTSFWEVSRTVREANPVWVCLALLSVLINTFVKGMRWYYLLGDTGKQAELWRVMASLLGGQLLNLIYPARAGDFSRILVIGEKPEQKAVVLGSVVLEKLADLVSYAILTLCLFIVLPLPTWLNQTAMVIAGLALLLFGLLIWLVSNNRRSEKLGRWLATRNIGWLSERIWLRIIQLVQITLTSLGKVKRRKNAMVLTALTLVVWVTALLTNWLIIIALAIPLVHPGERVTASLLILIGLIAGIVVPAIPGRIGVFEYICVLALGVFGINQTPALTYGILLHSVVFFPTIVLGAVGLLGMSWKVSR